MPSLLGWLVGWMEDMSKVRYFLVPGTKVDEVDEVGKATFDLWPLCSLYVRVGRCK